MPGGSYRHADAAGIVVTPSVMLPEHLLCPLIDWSLD